MIEKMSKEQLERELNEWKDKVLRSFDGAGSVNTYGMIVDVDRIIAEAFDHAPVIQEDLEPSVRFFED